MNYSILLESTPDSNYFYDSFKA